MRCKVPDLGRTLLIQRDDVGEVLGVLAASNSLADDLRLLLDRAEAVLDPGHGRVGAIVLSNGYDTSDRSAQGNTAAAGVRQRERKAG